MKTLVVYYSRDGHTKTIAQEIANTLGADIEEIREIKSRKGMKGYLSACKDAFLKKSTRIETPLRDPSPYDLVLIGTPIWAYTMACGVRSWLIRYGKALKRVAFFATMGAKGDKRAFREMKNLCGQPPKATATFIDKAVTQNKYKDKLEIFLKQLRFEEE